MIMGGYEQACDAIEARQEAHRRRAQSAPEVPTGELDDPTTVAALVLDNGEADQPAWCDDMPPCSGECGNASVRAVWDSTTAAFVPVCAECEPIPYTIA